MPAPTTILYIDDDPGIRRLVEKQLARRGFQVVSAASGAEGLEQVRAQGFDVIAVDHYMPGMDGLQTVEELRKLPDSPPIVYVTGSEESKVAVAALKAGASEYVVKSANGEFIDLLDQAFSHALANVRLQREKAATEAALKVSNERLETLLREVNHRVANSLQLVSTMVEMQSRLLTDEAAREALRDTQRRINAIGQIHQRLYTSADVQGVAMDEYLATLVTELEQSWSSPSAPRSIILAVEPLRLSTDKAVAVGVIVNELVSNACKYAYDETSAGEIRVEFTSDGPDRFRLIVEDDGCGMDAAASPRGTGLGSRLLTAMARTLSTTLDYERKDCGVRASLRAGV